MANIRSLVKYFYLPIMIWNLAFSLSGAYYIFVFGARVTGFMLFWKATGYASTIFLRSYTAKNIYMYYRNAGYSVKRMYAYTFALDMAIFIAMLIILFATLHFFNPYHAYVKS